MTARGLEEPLLVVSDGHKGLKKAVRGVFPRAFEEPFLAHKMRNIIRKVPRKLQKEIKGLVLAVFYASSYEQGLRQGNELIARFNNRYPSAMECPSEDLEECLTYLRFPVAHHKAISTTNLLERSFGEGRRQTKVMPRFPSEESCLRLAYASLITASKSWHGVRMTLDIRWQFEALRRQTFGNQKIEMQEDLVAV